MSSWLGRMARRFGWGGSDHANRRGVVSDVDPTGRGVDHSRDGKLDLPDPPTPTQAQFRTGRADLTRQHVAGSATLPYLSNVLKVLPFAIDDLTTAFGDDLYERMLLDYQCSASVNTLIYQILSEDLQIHPAVDDRKDPHFAVCKEITAFIERDLLQLSMNMSRLLATWLREMLQSLPLGSRLAEKTWRVCDSGKDAGRWCLASVKCKPRRNCGYVVNQFSDFIGVRAVMPGVTPYVIPQQTVLDPTALPSVLGREKFCHLGWDTHNNDPRGMSILRFAYEQWWDKRQVAQQYLMALAQFGSPSVLGFTPEGAIPDCDRDALGNPIGDPVEPTERLLQALIRFKAGGAAAFSHGTQVQAFFTSSAGEAFVKAMDRFDRNIASSIRLSTRDTHEAQFGSRADSETAQDVAGALIRYARSWVSFMVLSDLVYPSVRYNWGPEVARNCTPRVSISSVEHQDFSQTVSALVQMKSGGLLLPSQMQWAFERLGAPAPEPAEMAAAQQGQPGAPPAGAPPGAEPAPGGGGALADALPGVLSPGGSPDEAPPEGDGTLAGALPGLFGGGT